MSFKLVFSDYFDIEEQCLTDYGALNICLSSDLPLFIDPFLLFASEKKEYKELHRKIVQHLIDLKDIAISDSEDVNELLFCFPEIKQNWLGLCKYGNEGKGLGPKFAKSIIKAFNGFYSNFGEETLTEESHIEKLTLLNSGVGKDFISDFSVNLIHEFLLEYTQAFALKYLPEHKRKKFNVRCSFNLALQVLTPKEFELPYFFLESEGDYILLTPVDILTKDEAFISNNELFHNFHRITNSIGNESLRQSINSYFRQCLPPSVRKPQKEDKDRAIAQTISKFPELIDYYIKTKEQKKSEAISVSSEKIETIKKELLKPLADFCSLVINESAFFDTSVDSYSEALKRVYYLKDVIENNDGYRVFYKDSRPIASEDTIQRIFRLTWYASPYSVDSEVNNGRGPADYKVSFGTGDSTIVEFKLGRSTSLKRNLKNQTEIYKKASKSISDIKVILCYNISEINKVKRVLKELKVDDSENIVIIDASPKTSASKQN